MASAKVAELKLDNDKHLLRIIEPKNSTVMSIAEGKSEGIGLEVVSAEIMSAPSIPTEDVRL
tara:strand:- start:102 stop:287 length:186 start_codon:yes stop_codon:yes gene_type:complete